MDFEDLATGLAGGGDEGVWPTTVVPSHFQLRSYGPEHVVHLCASSLVLLLLSLLLFFVLFLICFFF